MNVYDFTFYPAGLVDVIQRTIMITQQQRENEPRFLSVYAYSVCYTNMFPGHCMAFAIRRKAIHNVVARTVAGSSSSYHRKKELAQVQIMLDFFCKFYADVVAY